MLTYLLGVQLPTFTINIPLNKQLQALNVDRMDEAMHESARLDFEPRWNQWNLTRTPLACFVSALLILVLFRLRSEIKECRTFTVRTRGEGDKRRYPIRLITAEARLRLPGEIQQEKRFVLA